jgi:hypothetical protein
MIDQYILYVLVNDSPVLYFIERFLYAYSVLRACCIYYIFITSGELLSTYNI